MYGMKLLRWSCDILGVLILGDQETNVFSPLQSATAEFKLPLIAVRPECAGILRDLPVDEAKLGPAAHAVSPYFMDNDDKEKYVKKGEIMVTLYVLRAKWISRKLFTINRI